MEQNHSWVHTPYHPRWLRQRVSTYWWLEKPAYLAFILREGSCMFVGWFTAYLLLLLRAIAAVCGSDNWHYSHSREFRSNIVDERPFWKQLASDFALTLPLQR